MTCRTIVVSALLLTLDGNAQVQRWSRTYGEAFRPNVLTSVVVRDSGYCFVNKGLDFQFGGAYTFSSTDLFGDTSFTRSFETPMYDQYGGYGGSFRSLSDGGFIMCDSRHAVGSTEGDGLLVKFNSLGDTLWTAGVGIAGTFDLVNAVDTVDARGFALFGTVQTGQYYDMRLIRTDTLGNVLWSQTYGGPEDQQCVSGHRTLDGGFVLAGFNYFNSANSDLYVVKTDSMGNQQWAHSYGSSWIDNAGFIAQLPDSGFILAGAVSIGSTVHHSCFYRLDPQGGVIWSNIYLDVPERNVFFTDPVVLWDGYAAAGSRSISGNNYGSLLKCDMSGDLVWRRIFQTNAQTDHYFYDMERTLDGGFIMAGTAFDSMLVSQDAWLVKVDSFGCLVPGCQVFDGLQEQFTDLVEVLTLYPNPVAAGAPLQVGIELPHGFNTTGELSLGLVSSDGRLVREQVLPNNATRAELPTTGLAPGLYFVHLRDGARWLCGGKVVVE